MLMNHRTRGSNPQRHIRRDIHGCETKMLLKKILLAGVVFAAATPASAANFAMTSGCGEDHSDESCTSIDINGEIEVEDGVKWKLFLEKMRTPHAVVTLNSPGGSVGAALLIANDILNR